MIALSEKALSRFVDKIAFSEDCWYWLAQVDKDGYGWFWFDGHNTRAHRISYEWFIGPIPEGMQLDHLCRNTGCERPEHLEPVTAQVNNLRGMSVAAKNARKTHCPQKHEYTEDNTYINPKGSRYCKICRKVSNKLYKEKLL